MSVGQREPVYGRLGKTIELSIIGGLAQCIWIKAELYRAQMKSRIRELGAGRMNMP
jgi:hypothetical protein